MGLPLKKPFYALPIADERLQRSRGQKPSIAYAFHKEYVLNADMVGGYLQKAVAQPIVELRQIDAPRSLCFDVRCEEKRLFVKLFYSKKSPVHDYALVKEAYALQGVESDCVCVDEKNGVYASVSTFIEGTPLLSACFSMDEKEKEECGKQLAEALKRLHEIEPKNGLAEWSVRKQLGKIRRRVRISFGNNEEAKTLYRFIKKNCKKEGGAGVCHTDLHLNNILCNKEEGKYTLIDIDGLAYGDRWKEFSALTFCPTALYPLLNSAVFHYFDGEVPKEFWISHAVGAAAYALLKEDDPRYLKTAIQLVHAPGFLPVWWEKKKGV